MHTLSFLGPLLFSQQCGRMRSTKNSIQSSSNIGSLAKYIFTAFIVFRDAAQSTQYPSSVLHIIVALTASCLVMDDQ